MSQNNNQKFIDVLARFDYRHDNQTPCPPLLFVSDYTTRTDLHPKQLFALETAKTLGADAVLFRYFEAGDPRFCIPQIYIYDKMENLDAQQVALHHRDVYSSCQVPIMMIVEKENVRIYDVRKPVKVRTNGYLNNQNCLVRTIDTLKDANSAVSLYHERLFANGSFWESDEITTHFLEEKTAYARLIQALKSLHSGYLKQLSEDKDIVFNNVAFSSLLIKLFLVKYLELNAENKNEHNGNVESDDVENFATIYFRKHNLPGNLAEILAQNRLGDLFTALRKHFNGGVFEISDVELEMLENPSVLATMALFLDGRLDKNKQIFIWQEYSFKHIPIELISSFYEVFIPEQKDAVYTPSYLADLLVDDCLPISIENCNEKIKIIDPSCGSGIFLATAYKRLVQRWRVRNRENNALANVTIPIAKRILKNSIFGVDHNKTAVNLSKFSLYIALCQLLTPAQIWAENTDKLFDNIDDNIIDKDFFDYLIENTNAHYSFDLVIGNPPFIADKKNSNLFKTTKQKLEDNNLPLACDIPDNQLALLFLDKAPHLLKKGGLLCFIQKATILLHARKSEKFREYLFNTYNIEQIIDFTLLKDILFKKAGVESLAIFIRNTPEKTAHITHIIAKSLQSNARKIFFEFDYYDFHQVSLEEALNCSHIWRCNLMGGGRLTQLITDLKSKGTPLKELVENDVNIGENRYGIGFALSKSAQNGTLCHFLGNKDFWVMSSDFHKNLLPPIKPRFIICRNELLYEGNLLLIKATIDDNKIPTRLITENAAFNEGIIGISTMTDEGNKRLDYINNCFSINASHYALLMLATTARFYWGKNTSIKKQDIDILPIPEQLEDLELSLMETIIKDDVLNHIYPSWYAPKKSVINAVISSMNIEKTMSDFATTYCEMLNSIYEKEGDKRAFRLTEVIDGNGFFACQFEFTDNETKAVFENNDVKLTALLNYEAGRSHVVRRIVRLYNGEGRVCLIKPKQLRYWLQSVAVRDADDTIGDILKTHLGK